MEQNQARGGEVAGVVKIHCPNCRCFFSTDLIVGQMTELGNNDGVRLGQASDHVNVEHPPADLPRADLPLSNDDGVKLGQASDHVNVEHPPADLPRAALPLSSDDGVRLGQASDHVNVEHPPADLPRANLPLSNDDGVRLGQASDHVNVEHPPADLPRADLPPADLPPVVGPATVPSASSNLVVVFPAVFWGTMVVLGGAAIGGMWYMATRGDAIVSELKKAVDGWTAGGSQIHVYPNIVWFWKWKKYLKSLKSLNQK